MIVDGEIYRANKDTMVKDKDGKVLALGSFDKISEGDQVEVKDNVVTVKVTAVEKEEAALKEAQDAVKALFKDAEKKELAKDVDQAAITAAKKLVDTLPADSTEDGAKTPKADLLKDIKTAQGLLDAANTADSIEVADKAITALEEAIKEVKLFEDGISEKTIADSEKTVKELKGLLADAQAALDKVDMKAEGRANLVTRLLAEEGKIEKFETKIEKAKTALEETIADFIENTVAPTDAKDNVSFKYADSVFTVTIIKGTEKIEELSGTGLIAGIPAGITKVEGIEVVKQQEIKDAIIAKFGDAETLADLADESIELTFEVEKNVDTDTVVFELTYTFNFR